MSEETVLHSEGRPNGGPPLKIYGKINSSHIFFEKLIVVLFLIRTYFSLETYIIRYAFSTSIIYRSPSDLLSKIKNCLQ